MNETSTLHPAAFKARGHYAILLPLLPGDVGPRIERGVIFIGHEFSDCELSEYCLTQLSVLHDLSGCRVSILVTKEGRDA